MKGLSRSDQEDKKTQHSLVRDLDEERTMKIKR
jgi:hypothetical protein